MRRLFSALSVSTLTLLLAIAPTAQASRCDGPFAVGFRVLTLDSGRKAAVWYPAAEHTAANGGAVRDAPPTTCPRRPLLLFSHGWGGCATQAVFLTESLARHGYVVAAPDHADAVCAVDGDALNLGALRIDRSFFDPASWDDRTQIGRLHDLRALTARVSADALLRRITDPTRVGAIGHSLGGYTVIGMAGGWPSWKTPQVTAVLALSPYVLPFLAHGTLARLQVPVMYQGGDLDWGMTTSLEGPEGAYAATAAPKFYVRLAGATHFEWTNRACAGQASVAACLQARPNAARIVDYGLAFFDRHLKGRDDPLLTAPARGVSAYWFALD